MIGSSCLQSFKAVFHITHTAFCSDKTILHILDLEKTQFSLNHSINSKCFVTDTTN